jgi:hypothetical protein
MINDDHFIFEIAEVEKSGENLWKVRGRNYYTTISVGDSLYISANPEEAFKVVSIRFYGHTIDEVSPGCTCELVVEGENGEKLLEATHFIRHSMG